MSGFDVAEGVRGFVQRVRPINDRREPSGLDEFLRNNQIFTAGLLMLATPRVWALAIVPIVWSAIGGSAASLLGVRADYALPIAGVALLLSLVFPKRHPRLVPS
jgi:hypothetical protein